MEELFRAGVEAAALLDLLRTITVTFACVGAAAMVVGISAIVYSRLQDKPGPAELAGEPALALSPDFLADDEFMRLIVAVWHLTPDVDFDAEGSQP